MALACPRVPSTGGFGDAIDLVFHKRESVSGGVCIGGLGEFGDLLGDHLVTSLLAIAIAAAIALPLGLWLGHIRKGEFLAVSVSNIGRAIPALALLAFFVAFVGVGRLNAVMVLTLLAIPPILTNTYVGVVQVDDDTVAAARGVGLTESQIVRQVEFPMAIPIIFAGLRTSAVAVVATATITPLANVPSLGTPILEPQTYGDSGQLAAAIVVALITFAVDASLTLIARTATPKGLRVGATQPVKRRAAFSLPTPARTET
jgi:osmoprotectant transport system permease protein